MLVPVRNSAPSLRHFVTQGDVGRDVGLARSRVNPNPQGGKHHTGKPPANKGCAALCGGAEMLLILIRVWPCPEFFLSWLGLTRSV